MTLVAQMHSYGYSYTVPVKQFFENIIPPTLGKDKGFSPKAKIEYLILNTEYLNPR